MDIALIEFSENGKKYYFKIPEKISLINGDKVVVETIQGLELGTVYNVKNEEDIEIVNNLKPILRKATKEDTLSHEINLEQSKEIVLKTKTLVEELELDEMFILDANYTLDKERLTIIFKSETRVDFRELVRELNALYQTRIELRQIGSRDVAKLIGGLGPCGLVLCCSTFIGEFDAVTIRMAKNQELSLNPRNISGICGKLLCCLKYEDEVYEELKELMPDVGSKVLTDKGDARVIDINFVGTRVKVKYFDDELASEWLDYRLLKE